MSIHITQLEKQGYKSRTTKPGRSRSEARVEVREGKPVNRITNASTTDVEPTEARSHGKTTTILKSSEKSIKITRISSGHGTSGRVEGTRRSAAKTEHVSSTVHFVASPKPKRTSKDNVHSISKQTSNAVFGIQKYVMADCDRNTFASRIPGIPQEGEDEQPLRKDPTENKPLPPFSRLSRQGHKFAYLSSVSTSVQSGRTEPCHNIDVSSYKQPTSKQPQEGLRVKGQSGSKIQRNADVECYPNKTDRSHRHSKPKSREDNGKSDCHSLVAESQQTERPNKLRVQTQERQTENITTEYKDTGMSHYDKKEQFSRQAHCNPLGTASNQTFTDSGSGDLSSSSDNEGCPSSAGHPKGHSNSPKRRKRVKRKSSAKSVGSSMYGDDNTTDGESATDTLTRVHDRRSRRKEDENNNNSAARQNNTARGKTAASGTSITTVKGAQFRSSSLTSVSSVEGGRGRSATSSPLLTPRGTTLVKKIQIQSFSATCTGFNKENREKLTKRRASAEEHIYDRSKEKTITPDHSGSISNLYGSLERKSSRSGTPVSRGRPFALRNKPFQLRRSSSKESPYTSEAESIGSPFAAKEETDTLSSINIPEFTDKPSRSLSPVSSQPKEVSISSSIHPTSPDFHIESQYSVSGIDDNVFSGPFAQSTPTHNSNGSILPGFEAATEEISSPVLETTPVSVGEPTQAIPIPGSSVPDDTSEWMSQSYPPLRTYPFDSDSYAGAGAGVGAGGPYGYRALSIVNEQEEMDGVQPTNTEGFLHNTYNSKSTNNNNNTAKNYWSSNQTERESGRNGRKSNDVEEKSAVRRPSYIRAQQNVENFALFRSFDDDGPSLPRETSLTNDSYPLQHEEHYDPKEVLKSFSGSDLEAHDVQHSFKKGSDLITFEDEHGVKKSSRHESSEEPVVKKRKKKIARPKIPTILNINESTSLEKEHYAAESNDDDDDNVRPMMIKAREETMGQDSMDEKCMDTSSFSKDSKNEEFDMIEASKRNTLVPIDSDDGSTPKATHSPASEPEESYLLNQDKELRSKQSVSQEKQSPSTGASFSLPQITTDLYVDQDDNSAHIPLKKVDTLYDLSEEESRGMGLMYVDQEAQDTKSVESFGSQSDGMSPSQSQSSLDKYSLTTSGFSEIVEDFSDSYEIPVQRKADMVLGVGKMSADGWRSHSDPSGRTNGAGAPLSETIAEAVELNSYRNSNSAPDLITEKLKKEAALLSERINSNKERPTISRTRSSPSSFTKPLIQESDQTRRKHLESKDDSQLKLSPDTIFDMDVGKASLKVHSAPSTPTSSRKQLYSNTFSAEKTQMKLAKLAAMEPIYETPQTELVKPLPAPVKLERKCGVSPAFEEPERPPATGVQESKPQDKLQPKPKSKHDIKRHVLQNLLETEQSYVQNLQYLVTAYYKPLKKTENANIVDPAQVDEMFYQISDILLCHEFFLEQLESRVDDWHDKQKIGDILVASFTKCFLMDAYSAFINHFLHARAAVRIATVSRPGFQRFIEQCCRDHKEKLTLQDLMIMPVQRIPRYVLILKDMIKHTTQDHPDYGNLLLALGEIRTLADRMNKGEKEVNEAEIEADRLRDIEASIEGITELVVPNRRFLRKDLAAEVRGTITKKDRCLFLFTDLLVCASVKRKPNALRRGSLSLFSGQSGSEFNKHKLLWKMPLEYVELVKSSPELQRRNSLEKQIEKLENDMSVLSQISSLTDSLNVSHQALDASIRELMNEVGRQIAEKQIPMHQSLNTRIELQAQTEDGLENFVFLFLDVEIKNTWEAYFENAKQKLAYAKDTFPPEFQHPIPITKTRSGMQFTCSSPSQVPHMLDRGNHCGSGDVWVCNSDGYVGQVCILSMGGQIQPIASLSVCSSRILCISPVPGTKLVGLENAHHDDSKSDSRSIGNNGDSGFKVSGQKLSTGYSSDDERNAQTIMAFDSSSDDEEGMNNDGFLGSKFGRNSPIYDGRLSPEGSSLGTIDGEMDSSHEESDIDESEDDETKAKASQRHSRRRDSARTTGSVTSAEDKLSLSDIVPYDTEEGSTVWLGTEDGSIFVYPTLDAHQKKNKMKIQHQASVQCILYVDNQVFVSLGNGDLCIYRRQPGSAWEVGAPITLQVGSSAPVSCMTAVHGRLWCGCQCNAVIYNTTTLKIETQFNCSLDKDRSVYRMVSSGMGVWLSLQSSAVIRLFHATRYECLADVDVAPPVHKMLAGSDAIIRQHKAACLRVTSLLTCKDLLWIGTSAGVVLTLPLPTITATTSSLRNSPSATASYHGHTGHVRFLTAVEVPKEGAQDTTSDKEPITPVTPTSTSGPPLTPGGPAGSNIARDILIISGGDGYEDFKTSSTSESAGRDDSTNHLLIWRV